MLLKRLRSRGAGYLTAVLGIAATAAVCSLLRNHVNDMIVAVAMLLVVLMVAGAWGRWPALAAAVLGVACLDYFFLPPHSLFTIADSKSWIALAAFAVAASVAGQHSPRLERPGAGPEDDRSQASPPRPVRAAIGRPWYLRPDPRVIRHLHFFVAIASWFAVAVGLLSAVGLIFHISVLKSVLPGRPVIKMNAAVCLVLLGLSLWLLRKTEDRTRPGIERLCGQILAGIAALIGLLSLTEHWFGWNLGIDQWPYREPAEEAFVRARPGLMAPFTAVDFLLLGIALILLDRAIIGKSRRYWPAQYLASLTAMLSLAGLLDFLVESHNLSYTHVALQTAVSLQLLSLGLLLVRTDRGLAALLASSTEGGALLRRLLPAAIFIPIVIGALSWSGLAKDIYSGWDAISLMIVAMIALLGALAFWNGYIVNRGELERASAERELLRSETELREAQRLAQVGSWLWDPNHGRVTWSEGLSRLMGRDPALPPPTYKEHLRFHMPASSARLDAAVQRAIQSGASFERELEMVRADGDVRTVMARGEVERDAQGQVALVRGTIQDITESKRTEEALRESAEEIRDLYNNAPCGYHSLDSQGFFVQINDTELKWLGYQREEVIGKHKFSDFLTPECLDTFKTKYATFKKEGFIRDVELEMVRKDGTTFPVVDSATAIRDKAGNYLMSRSTIFDITERKRAEDEIRLLARLQEAAAALGERALRAAHLSAVFDDAVGQVAANLNVEYSQILELLPNREALLLKAGTGWKAGYVGHALIGLGTESQAVLTLLSGEPVLVEDLQHDNRFGGASLLREHQIVSGASVVISTNEGPYGVLAAHTRLHRVFAADEVNFLQSVANVLGSAIERHRSEAKLWRINQAQRALSKCNEALIRATDESILLRQICGLVVEEAGYRLCWVGRAESDSAKSVVPVARAGFDAGYLATLNVSWADTERGLGPVGTCIRTRETVVVKNIATDPRMIPWRDEAQKRGYASVISIPLIVDSAAFGALTIYSAELEAFRSEEVGLLTELAGDLAFGIATLHIRAERAGAEEEIRTLNAELEQRVASRTAQLQNANAELEQAREREIEIGFKIQQTLLFDQPPKDVPGLRVAALSIPSQRIDGDFYMFIRHSDQYLDVIVGDVMGKGIPAALLGAATKSHFLRALGDLMVFSEKGKLPEPREIVMQAHAGLARHLIDLDSFVTLVYARFDENRRRLEVVDCGHTGTVHFHGRTGQCELIQGNNLPLGVREGEIYDQISAPFEPGDLLLFFSDGITEARNASGELFGVERLEACVAGNGHLQPEALVEDIRQAVFAFSGSNQLTDDLTALAVRVEERQLPIARAEIEIDSNLHRLRQVREFVRTFCRDLPGGPLDWDRAGSLELAVNEAASNIMKHAYQGRPDQWIRLEAEAFPGYVVIRLHHLGEPFDPSSAPPPLLDGSRESGFGTYIISRSGDEVRYYRDDRGRNCIALTKVRKS